MKYFESRVNDTLVKVVGAQSVEDCVEYFGGSWVEIKSPPYIGLGEDGNYLPFPMTTPPEALLVEWDQNTEEWVILN